MIPKLIPQESNYDSTLRASYYDSEIEQIFLNEITESLKHCYEEKNGCLDYVIIEINSSRFAYNIESGDVIFFLIKAMLNVSSSNLNPLDRSAHNASNLFKEFKQIYNYFGNKLLTHYIKNEPIAMKNCLNGIVEYCEENINLQIIIKSIVVYLYYKDILDEETIISWFINDLKLPWAKSQLLLLIKWFEETTE